MALSPADFSRLARRDLASDTAAAMDAATALGHAAVTAAGDNQCQDTCPQWLDSATACATDVTDVAGTLECACSEDFLSSMKACAACIAEDAPSQAQSALSIHPFSLIHIRDSSADI